MTYQIAKKALSLNGLSLSLGALGFLSGVVQLFIDINQVLSVKWLLAVVWFFISLTLVLFKVIFDLSNEKHPAAPYEVPIKYIEDQSILVIRRNDNFLNNIIVGCYIRQDEIDSLACVGVVHMIQEKVIQIKIFRGFIGSVKPPEDKSSLDCLMVRPVVPYDALNQFSNTSD